jgi:hypothetical protein
MEVSGQFHADHTKGDGNFNLYQQIFCAKTCEKHHTKIQTVVM